MLTFKCKLINHNSIHLNVCFLNVVEFSYFITILLITTNVIINVYVINQGDDIKKKLF